MFRRIICFWLLWGTEVGRLSAEIQRKLEAFSMWCDRKMLKIPYIVRETSVEVLRKMDVQRQLLDTHRRRKLVYFGYVTGDEGRLSEMAIGKKWVKE